MNQGKRSDNPFFRTVQLAHEAAAERRAASAADESASGDGPAAARSLGRQLPPVHVGVSPPRGVAGEGGPTWTALWAVEERGVASLEEVLRRAQSMGDGIAFRMVLARKPEEGGAGGVDGSEKAGWSVNALLRAASVRLAMCDEEEPGGRRMQRRV